MSSLKINVKFQGIIMKIEKNGIFPREDKFESRAENGRLALEAYIRGAKARSACTILFRLLDSLHLEALGITLDMSCFYDGHSITRRTRTGSWISCSNFIIELRSA